MDPVQAVSRCRFFAHCSPHARSQVVAMARPGRIEAGGMLFRQDDPCPGLFVVAEGLVRVFKISPNGKEHILHLAGPGQTFAEVAAIGGFPCPAFAAAVEATDYVLLPNDDFRALLDRDHGFCRELLTGMALWVRHFADLLEDVVLRDANGRLARYLLQCPCRGDGTVLLPAARGVIGNHLDLTPETVSRALRRLSKRGLLELTAGRIGILDREGLGEIAEGGGGSR